MKKALALLIAGMFLVAGAAYGIGAQIPPQPQSRGVQIDLDTSITAADYVLGPAFPLARYSFDGDGTFAGTLYACDATTYSADLCDLAATLGTDSTAVIETARRFWILRVATPSATVSYLNIRGTDQQVRQGSGGIGSGQLVINEALKTAIRTAIVDDDGDTSGFVELRNNGGSLDVAGYTLTPIGSPHPPFTLPSVTVAAGGYLRIWTGAKNDVTDTTNLHAPFDLAGASSVELRNPTGEIVDVLDISFLAPDYTYGLCQESCAGRAYEFFDATSTASTGSANTAATGAVRREIMAPHEYSVPVRRTTQIPAYYTPTNGGNALPIGSAATAALDWGWMQLDATTGRVYTDFDASDKFRLGDTGIGQPNNLTQATLTFTKAADSNTATTLTVSDWEANFSSINWTRVVHNDVAQGRLSVTLNGVRLNDGWVYYGIDGDDTIYRTNDGFITWEAIGVRPTGQTDWDEDDRLLRTSFGDFYFAKELTGKQRSLTVYRSLDGMGTWAASDVGGVPGAIRETPLAEGYDWYFDATTNTGYVATGEYDSCSDTAAVCADTTADYTINLPHRVWLATFSGADLTSGAGDFVVVKTFDSRTEFQGDPATYDEPAAHIHTVWFDPWTGDLWVGAGDEGLTSGLNAVPEVRLIVSNDFASSWYTMAVGKQSYRVLSVWGTERGIYMNTDSGQTQIIYHIPRSERGATTADEYDPITPTIAGSGNLTGGLYYQLQALDGASVLDTMDVNSCGGGCVVGQRVRDDTVGGAAVAAGDQVVRLGSLEKMWGIVDDGDYRTKVATLDNSDHYYTAWADASHSVRLISGANNVINWDEDNSINRTTRRGDISYLWTLTEEPDGGWRVQEVHAELVEPEELAATDNIRRQFRPSGVDANGNIYLYTPKVWSTMRVGRLSMGAVAAAQTNGIDFTRDPDAIGCYTFEDATPATDLGNDSCVWTSGLLDDTVLGNGSTVQASNFVNIEPAGEAGAGLAGQTTGPFGAGSYALDVTDVELNQRALYYNDSTARDFQDIGMDGYTMGCFFTSQKTGTADAVLFSHGGNRASVGSHGLFLDYNASNYYLLATRGLGLEVPSAATLTASLGTWHFGAQRVRRVLSKWSELVAVAAGGTAGIAYTGERDVFLDGVRTDGVGRDAISTTSHDQNMIVMGAFPGGLSDPPTNYQLSLNGYMAECFWTRRDMSDEELCQICSCGLEGDVATGTGLNATVCNSCTMAQTSCESNPFN